MSSQMKTFNVSFSGGLDTRSTLQGLQDKPGYATDLVNFEQNIGGGYRRINGFTKLTTTTLPGTPSDSILGIFLYREGTVVCKGDAIYHSFDNVTWKQVNKDIAAGGNEAALDAAAALPRGSAGKYSFDTFTQGAAGGVVELLIHDGGNEPAILTITGTSVGTANYKYAEISVITNGSVGILHADQHIVAGDSTQPSNFHVSKVADMADFTTGASGTFSVADPVIGLKSFREILYIFCANSVWKATDLSSGTPLIEPVFRNIGCISNGTIQEVGGDIMFLATDGLRSLGATARIGDVNVPSTSLSISGLIQTILQNRSTFTFTSTVLRERNQYRLFYTDEVQPKTKAKGIIATYSPGRDSGTDWSYSETLGIAVTSISFGIQGGRDVLVHGDQDGGLFNHDTSLDFDGVDIPFQMTTPYFSMGDVGLRKNGRELVFYIEQEGATNIDLLLKYDYEDGNVHQPLVYPLAQTTTPAIWGSAVWGTDTWGSGDRSIDKLPIQGSFQTASLTIQNGTPTSSAPFTVQGYTMNYTDGSRI